MIVQEHDGLRGWMGYDRDNSRFSAGTLISAARQQTLLNVSSVEAGVNTSVQETVLVWPAAVNGVAHISKRGIFAMTGNPTYEEVFLYGAGSMREELGDEFEGRSFMTRETRSMGYSKIFTAGSSKPRHLGVWPQEVWDVVEQVARDERVTLVPQADGPQRSYSTSNGGTVSGRCDTGNDVEMALGVTTEVADHSMRSFSNMEMTNPVGSWWAFMDGSDIKKLREMLFLNKGAEADGKWRDIKARPSTFVLIGQYKTRGFGIVELKRVERMGSRLIVPLFINELPRVHRPLDDMEVPFVLETIRALSAHVAEALTTIAADILENADSEALPERNCHRCGVGLAGLVSVRGGLCYECRVAIGAYDIATRHRVALQENLTVGAAYEALEADLRTLGITRSDLICSECGGELAGSYFRIVGHRVLHEDCLANAGYRECDRCGEASQDTRYYERVDEDLCEGCAGELTPWEAGDENYERCESCDGEFDTREEGYSGYCDRCWERQVDRSDMDEPRKCHECEDYYTPYEVWSVASLVEELDDETEDQVREVMGNLCEKCGHESVYEIIQEYRTRKEEEQSERQAEQEEEAEREQEQEQERVHENQNTQVSPQEERRDGQ